MYALMTFGIQKDGCPYDDEGFVRQDLIKEYIKQRRIIEEMEAAGASNVASAAEFMSDGEVYAASSSKHLGDSSPFSEPSSSTEGATPVDDSGKKVAAKNIIEFPTSQDILLGRGRPYQEYPGNLALSEIIEQHRQRYQLANRFEKTCISKMVVQIVKEQRGARFLQRAGEDSKEWEEVSDSVAREKVSHGFRTKTRRIKLNPSPLPPPTNTQVPTSMKVPENVAAIQGSSMVPSNATRGGTISLPNNNPNLMGAMQGSNFFQPILQSFNPTAVLPPVMNWAQQQQQQQQQMPQSTNLLLSLIGGGGASGASSGNIEHGRIPIESSGRFIDQNVSFPMSSMSIVTNGTSGMDDDARKKQLGSILSGDTKDAISKFSTQPYN